MSSPRLDLGQSERDAILRHVAHRAAEDTDNRDGWCRWSTFTGCGWEWGDYKPLVAAGLLERRETWKDVLLRLTDKGWHLLQWGIPNYWEPRSRADREAGRGQ